MLSPGNLPYMIGKVLTCSFWKYKAHYEVIYGFGIMTNLVMSGLENKTAGKCSLVNYGWTLTNYGNLMKHLGKQGTTVGKPTPKRIA